MKDTTETGLGRSDTDTLPAGLSTGAPSDEQVIGFTGRGQFDSHDLILSSGKPNHRSSAGTPYAALTLGELRALVAAPPEAEKGDGQWCVTSSYREHDARRTDAQGHGGVNRLALGFDFDKGNPSLEQVDAGMRQVFGPDVYVLTYYTSSTTETISKVRALVVLGTPLPGHVYRYFMKACHDALKAVKLKPDAAMERPAQIFYLPSKVSSRAVSWKEAGTKLLEQTDVRHLVDAAVELSRVEQTRRDTLAKDYGANSIIRRFCHKTDLADLAAKYGWEQVSETEWRSLHQQNSGSQSVCQLVYSYDRGHDVFFDHSDAGREIGYGSPGSNACRIYDAATLLEMHEFPDQKQRSRYMRTVLDYGAATPEHGRSIIAGLNYVDGNQILAKPQDGPWEVCAPEPISIAPSSPPQQVKIFSADEFLADFVPPSYLVDGLFQQSYLSIVTAAPGAGKTAILLDLAVCVSSGIPYAGREVEQGNVIFMAGENPDDVRARVFGLCSKYTDPDTGQCGVDMSKLFFIPGTFDIEGNMEKIHDAMSQLDGISMIVIDTLAAYNNMDDENDAKMGRFVHMLRKLIEGPGSPAVIVAAHPKKGATKDNMEPRGSSAILGEIDCAYTLWQGNTKDRIATLSPHAAKFRGEPFLPIDFQIRAQWHPALVDRKGMQRSTPVSFHLQIELKQKSVEEQVSTTDRILLYLDERPNASRGELETNTGISRSTLSRKLSELVKEGLIEKTRHGQYALKTKGTKWVAAYHDGEKSVNNPDGIADDD